MSAALRSRKMNGKIEARKIRPGSIIAFVLMLVLLIVIAFTSAEETKVNINTLQIDIGMIALLFFGGLIASIAMITRESAGSFVMVLLGIYPIVTGAISMLLPFHMDTFLGIVLPIGIPAGLGIIAGLLIGAKLIDLLIKKFPQETYFGILGLLLGSLFELYPGFSFDWQGGVSVLVLLFGFALAYFSSSEWLKNKFIKSRA